MQAADRQMRLNQAPFRGREKPQRSLLSLLWMNDAGGLHIPCVRLGAIQVSDENERMVMHSERLHLVIICGSDGCQAAQGVVYSGTVINNCESMLLMRFYSFNRIHMLAIDLENYPRTPYGLEANKNPHFSVIETAN